MSHVRVKTTYESEGSYAGTDIHTLYCHHNLTCCCTTFYNADGTVAHLSFCSWSTGNDFWDAVQRLWFPYKDTWGGELKDGVEYYSSIELKTA